MTATTTAAPWRNGDGLRYGLLGLPLAFCALPLYILMPNLYARQWGVPLAALGALLLAVRLLDAVIDPLLGRYLDRLFARSPRAVLQQGALAAMALAVGFSLLLMPQVREPEALLWWAGIWLVVTYTAYSALTVAHQSWGAMLGGDARYRGRVVAWREGLALLGVMLAALAPAIGGVPVLLWLLGAALVAGYWAWCHAPRPELAAHHPDTDTTSLPWWHPWRNTGFRALLAVYLLNGIASAIPATLVLFFVQDRLQGGAALQSMALGTYFACGALSMPVWLHLVGRLGLERSWQWGMLLAVLVFVGASQLGAGDAAWFLLVCALSGTALGSDLALPGALLAGVIDRAGDRGRADASYFGWWNFATKINLALAAGLTLPLLGWLGYTPGTQDPAALALLSTAYCLLPCGLKALAAWALQFLVLQPTTRAHTP